MNTAVYGSKSNITVYRSNRRAKAGRNIMFAVFTAALILISAFFVAGTVQSQTADQCPANETYFQALEKDYISRIRKYLEVQGFENAGVTMTRIVDAEGNREYTILVHHRYLEKLSAEALADIFREIEENGFAEDGCIFQVNLLI